MAYQISFVEPAGGKLAHQVMIERVRDLAAANGWTVLRFDDSGVNHEVILKGVGLSGLEEIYIGFRTYQNSGADYYNLLVGCFTGYVPTNSFDTQPGAYLSGVPAHNNRIDYWIVCNAQRIACAMKVGTPVYEPFYAGKMFPYGRPSQYPYPLICGGSLVGAAATRFSEGTHNFMIKGGANARMGLRTNDSWVNPSVHPYDNAALCGATQLRDTNGKYTLMPIEIYSTNGLYGSLDGLFQISGFNNAVENTIVIGGVTYVVFQNVWRTGFADYFAMRMQ